MVYKESLKNKPIRILHVVTTMDHGGVETLLMEIYRNIDRSKVQFDFLCHNTLEGKFCDEIRCLGGRVYCVKSVLRSFGSYLYKRQVRRFFNNHPEYKIVHSHINGGNGYILQIAKEVDVPIRISHSHVANRGLKSIRDYYYIDSMVQINRNATDYFACSSDAARFLYSNKEIEQKTIVFNNAINTRKFKFSNSSRIAIRKEMNLEDKFVFVHVGRFMEEKNHKFIIDIFSEIQNKISNAILLLIGEGPLVSTIKAQAQALGVCDKVVFLGSKSNVFDYLSASDAFLFPSLFEGLGIVAVEAQCSGLPTFASDKVPEEAKRTDLLQFIPLTYSAVEWAERIVPIALKTHEEEYLNTRVDCANDVKESGYDIVDKAKWLEEFYLNKYAEVTQGE